MKDHQHPQKDARMALHIPRHQPDEDLSSARLSQIESRTREDVTLAAAIQEIHFRGATAVGDNYFAAITEDLAKHLNADFVFVGRLVDNGNAVETVAISANGQPVENMTYRLDHTPCDVALGRGGCIYPRNVAAEFPKDELLRDLGSEGYVGISLVGTDGSPVGIMVALYQKPIENSQFAHTLMLVFAARTASEIDRMRQAERAKLRDEQMLRTQKLEGLGVLAGGLAHDFNNLLTSMLGSADLALLLLPEVHPSREHLDLIRDTAKDAGDLCRQLLAYAGKGRFQLVPVNLSALVLTQEKLLRMSTTKSASLHFDLDDDLPACRADQSQIRQILLNLVVNASEALVSGRGTIHITTGHGTYSSDYLESSDLACQCAPGPYVFVEVSDSGSGMSEEVQANVFDPFFTTKLTGRGLGLAAILGIVSGHGGTIKVDSEVGFGSSFKIFFPVIEEKAMTVQSGPSTDSWTGVGNILLVEDDERVAKVCSMMLKVLGFQPIVALCGSDAVEIYKERSAELVAVVLDLTMPGMNGDEVLCRMRTINSRVPVILTSGFNEQDTVQEFVGRGLAGFLQKPVQLQDLRERLRLATEGPSAPDGALDTAPDTAPDGGDEPDGCRGKEQ